MNVKTYRTKSLQEALDHIKRDLGSEALVLSTREVAPRAFSLSRRPMWEVSAAQRQESAGAVATLAAPAAPVPMAKAAAAVAVAPAPVKMPKPAEPKDMDDAPVIRRA